MESIFVYGAGGHARVILDTLKNGIVEYGVTTVADDDPALHGTDLLGQVIRGEETIRDERGFVAIGNNKTRLLVASRFRGRLVTLVHRRAFVSDNVVLGEGTLIMAGAIVNVCARVGSNSIINTGATVGHDAVIGDGVHVAPGCNLCGGVDIGDWVLLGVGTVVVPGVKIGRNAFVHAGQVITRDVPEGATIRTPRLKEALP